MSSFRIEYASPGKFLLFVCLSFFLFSSCEKGTNSYEDRTFFSESFDTTRSYRIYLPKNYHAQNKTRYPVVYYFHGYGGRYKWDEYDLKDDAKYPGNGRKEPPFVMEWEKYVNENDLIIVTWDGYEPNLHPGKKEREGIRYGGAPPYDHERAHDTKNHHWGWNFSTHFRELVSEIDKQFRTIADRDHRGITGLSMGGLTAFYVAGQNKDLVNSVSAFDPADSYPRYGPKGEQAVLPVLEMHRALKGLGVRLTMTDGDWLKFNNEWVRKIYGAADLTHFETHMASYPNHWAADIDKQLDFHMHEFAEKRPAPKTWNHINPAFKSFDFIGYNVKVNRKKPALTILEDVSPRQMKVLAREFIPEGPIILEEKIEVTTPALYVPGKLYQVALFNLSNNQFSTNELSASQLGELTFELNGGGHLVGINELESPPVSNLRIVFENNQERFYFEEGATKGLDFKLVNVGNKPAENIEIKAFTSNSEFKIANEQIRIPLISNGKFVSLKDQFKFNLRRFDDSASVSDLLFEIKVNGIVQDTISAMAYTTPKCLELRDEDIIVLDGRSVTDVPMYQQGLNVVKDQTISGGEGNGNGVLESGEKAVLYVRIPKGMGENDLKTFHRSYLVNIFDDPFLHVKELDYREKASQAGATSVASVLTVAQNLPVNHTFNLRLKVESLHNIKDDPTSNATIYGHRYDYVRVQIKGNKK